MILNCAGKALNLSSPCVMGILNVTPDSFSDGGVFLEADAALEQALRMVADGAAIIDIGGESTRPGAQAVSEQEELDRVIPIIEALAKEIDVPISIDTNKPEVMRAAVSAGAGMINDVMALQVPGALEAAQQLSVPVCLMHMQGEPRTMQQNPQYQDVVADILAFFEQRIEVCVSAGIERSMLLVDPGFGFGKRLEHNQQLLKNLGKLQQLKLPLLVGISRKSMIGAMLNDASVDQRLHGSVAAAVMAYERGAAILRVHDVKPTVDALTVAEAVLNIDN
ncbi:MAG: dihydropteroate synthase [Chromatiales bacterium]|nr:dihydropteroate synthase [Chromatiales bacterium]